MKKKDLMRLMKESYDEVEIKDYTNEILAKVDHRAVVEEKHKRHFFMPIGIAMAGILLIASLLFLFPHDKIKPIEGPLEVGRKEEVLSREIIALGNIIGDLDTNTASLMSYEFTTSEYDEIAREVNKYLYTTNIFMESDNISIEYILNEDKPYSNYKYKMEIAFRDTSFTSSYLAYYNEIKDSNTVEIEGIILIDGIERELFGEREDSGDEVELELKVKTGAKSYISIKNETEVNENEYQYTFVENDVVVKGVSMEVELEGAIKETEIKITEYGETKSFEFTYNEDNIEATYKDSLAELEMVIIPYESYYIYTFEGTDYELKLNK